VAIVGAREAVSAATAATATTASSTSAMAATATSIVFTAPASLHLGDDLGIVFGGERLLRDGPDLVFAANMGTGGFGELGRSVEQRLASAGPRFAVEVFDRGCDLGLHRDLLGMLGGQLGQRGGKLGPPGRQPREHRAFFVDEVAGDGALEVGDGS